MALLTDVSPHPSPQQFRPMAGWAEVKCRNTQTRVQALNGFRREWFLPPGAPGLPSAAQVAAINDRLRAWRRGLDSDLAFVRPLVSCRPGSGWATQYFLHRVDLRIQMVQAVWHRYFQIFIQRRSIYGPFLQACDRLALDCYGALAGALPRGIATPPLVFLDRGFSPSTIRRGVLMPGVGAKGNPFPLIKVPYDRIATPWDLGSIMHECGHDLQTDLGLWHAVPAALEQRLCEAGLPRHVVQIWLGWQKEIFADMLAILLGGPASAWSLLDLLTLPVHRVLVYQPGDLHPTPFVRSLINADLLGRLKLRGQAAALLHSLKERYPRPQLLGFPPQFTATMRPAAAAVVDTIVFQPYTALGGRSLFGLVPFGPADQRRVLDCACALLRGERPAGHLPRRVVAASRYAFMSGRIDPERLRRLTLEAIRDGGFHEEGS